MVLAEILKLIPESKHAQPIVQPACWLAEARHARNLYDRLSSGRKPDVQYYGGRRILFFFRSGGYRAIVKHDTQETGIVLDKYAGFLTKGTTLLRPLIDRPSLPEWCIKQSTVYAEKIGIEFAPHAYLDFVITLIKLFNVKINEDEFRETSTEFSNAYRTQHLEPHSLPW